MRRFLTLLFVLAVVGGSWFIYSREEENGDPARPEGITTAFVTRDGIEAVISATGNVAAERVRSLAFATSGTVAEVLVEEGELVQAGQMLARLDARDLELSLKQSAAALHTSEAQLARAQVGPAPEDIATMEIAVELSQAGIQSAQASVDGARANLARIKAGSTAEEIEISERRIEEAKNSLWGAQSQRDAVCGRVQLGASQADCDNAEASVFRAEEGVRIAELQLQQLQAGARSEDIASTQSQLDQALGQLKSAQIQVKKAQADLVRAKKGPTAEDIAISRAQVEQARVSVEIASSRLDDLALRAPIPGELARWDLSVEDSVAPGTPVGTLMDVSKYHIIVSIDETEIGQVAVGQEVRTSLDAFPGSSLQGVVSKISLSGNNAQGIVTYDVRIDLSPSSFAVKPLMTAVVDIVVERKDDVLLVANRAIRRDKDGTYVEVLRNNVPAKVYITAGVADEEHTEVLTGLEEGQEIIVSRPRENLFSGGPFGGG